MSTANSPEIEGTKRPLALIAGPTASGKTDLAVRLALAHGNAIIINADSAQVYADLKVLSARPSAAEEKGVPHRLFGTWDGSHACSAAEWAAVAKREIAAAHAADTLPILVGGTGLYIRTLIDGIAPVPAIDPEIRAAVRAMPVAEAHEALKREDPARAAELAAADTTRVARALEVVRSTGRTLAAWQLRRAGGIGGEVAIYPLVLVAEREWLNSRCDRRFAAMLDNGAPEEVRTLLERDLDPALPVMRAIGVREVAGWLNNALSRDEAILAGQLATRRYAKRQATWFRHQAPEDWLRANAENVQKDGNIELLFPFALLT